MSKIARKISFLPGVWKDILESATEAGLAPNQWIIMVATAAARGTQPVTRAKTKPKKEELPPIVMGPPVELPVDWGPEATRIIELRKKIDNDQTVYDTYLEGVEDLPEEEQEKVHSYEHIVELKKGLDEARAELDALTGVYKEIPNEPIT